MRALHLSLAPLASQFPVTDTQQQNLPPPCSDPSFPSEDPNGSPGPWGSLPWPRPHSALLLSQLQLLP